MLCFMTEPLEPWQRSWTTPRRGVAIIAAFALVAIGTSPAGPAARKRTPPPRSHLVPLTRVPGTAAAVPPAEVTVAAAGDLACRPGQAPTPIECRQQEVSDLVLADRNVTKVLLLGDLQYENGELDGFRQSYEASYGRFKDRSVPAPGNHEYNTPGATGYYAYFGAAAHPETNGYYSLDLSPSWHLVVLNSNCGFVACDAASEQVRWLRADLARSTKPCTIAIWHHPRFTSAQRGGNLSTAPFFDALYAAGADLVVSGHEHQYERFDPQRPDETPDPTRGIREFVVGTGGRSVYPFATPRPNSVQRAIGIGVARSLRPGKAIG